MAYDKKLASCDGRLPSCNMSSKSSRKGPEVTCFFGILQFKQVKGFCKKPFSALGGWGGDRQDRREPDAEAHCKASWHSLGGVVC